MLLKQCPNVLKYVQNFKLDIENMFRGPKMVEYERPIIQKFIRKMINLKELELKI